jgi:hypothetical protein
MTAETKSNERENRRPKVVYNRGASEAVYGFGLIGAWVYYIGHATTIGMGALGILKGVVWPAMLVYEVMKYLHM